MEGTNVEERSAIAEETAASDEKVTSDATEQTPDGKASSPPDDTKAIETNEETAEKTKEDTGPDPSKMTKAQLIELITTTKKNTEKELQSGYSKQILEWQKKHSETERTLKQLQKDQAERAERAQAETLEKAVKDKLLADGVDEATVDRYLEGNRDLKKQAKDLETKQAEFEDHVRTNLSKVSEEARQNEIFKLFFKHKVEGGAEILKGLEEFSKKYIKHTSRNDLLAAFYEDLLNENNEKESIEKRSEVKPSNLKGSGSAGKDFFYEDEIESYDFYVANKDAILKAQKEGKIKKR
jgi:hypothetical protein